MKLRLLVGCRVNTEYVPKVSMCTLCTKIKAPTQIPIRCPCAAPHWKELRYFQYSLSDYSWTDVFTFILVRARSILCKAQTRTHDKLTMIVFLRNAYALGQLYTVLRGNLPGVCWPLVANALAPVWGQAISSHYPDLIVTTLRQSFTLYITLQSILRGKDMSTKFYQSNAKYTRVSQVVVSFSMDLSSSSFWGCFTNFNSKSFGRFQFSPSFGSRILSDPGCFFPD